MRIVQIAMFVSLLCSSITAILVTAERRTQAEASGRENCDWIYQKARQLAVEADETNKSIIEIGNNASGWRINHRAEMSRTWSLLYLACKENQRK